MEEIELTTLYAEAVAYESSYDRIGFMECPDCGQGEEPPQS